MTDIKMYLVGGAVRDGLLGVPTKDFDYSIVVDTFDGATAEDAYWIMHGWLEAQGFNIFLSTPEYFTIRAKFPKGHVNEKQTADFVLARKDGPYSDSRRPDFVLAGTLEDDLARRDFTVNALAESESGIIINMFGGIADLVDKRLRAVGDPKERLLEDPLRAYRAVRFAVTKGFFIDPDLKRAMYTVAVLDKMEDNVSADRIREELRRCFAHDSVATVSLLAHEFPQLLGIMQRKGIWLEPTSRKA